MVQGENWPCCFSGLDWVIEIRRNFPTAGNSWNFNPAEHGARPELALLFFCVDWAIEIMRNFSVRKQLEFIPAE
jgi:hypothetical protein